METHQTLDHDGSSNRLSARLGFTAELSLSAGELFTLRLAFSPACLLQASANALRVLHEHTSVVAIIDKSRKARVHES
jgi:hypothetical protein